MSPTRYVSMTTEKNYGEMMLIRTSLFSSVAISAGLVILLFSGVGCAGDSAECGKGTVKKNGKCVAKSSTDPKQGFGATCEETADCGCFDTESHENDHRCVEEGTRQLECLPDQDGENSICTLGCSGVYESDCDEWFDNANCTSAGRCER